MHSAWGITIRLLILIRASDYGDGFSGVATNHSILNGPISVTRAPVLAHSFLDLS